MKKFDADALDVATRRRLYELGYLKAIDDAMFHLRDLHLGWKPLYGNERGVREALRKRLKRSLAGRLSR